MSDLSGRPVIRVRVPSPVGDLEGLFRPAADPFGGAVVCHPHPVYGGDMRNRVVVAAARGLVAAGLSTLRFNFRGAGGSPGTHDGGRGERDDVRAALAFLEAHVPGGPLLVAGYSFGCTVGLEVGAAHPGVAALLGLGVSFRLLTPPDVGGFGGPMVFVQGDRDELGPLEEVRSWVETLPGNARLVTVEGADHFFTGDLSNPVQATARDLAASLRPARR